MTTDALTDALRHWETDEPEWCLKIGPRSRALVRHVFESAYIKGRTDGLKEATLILRADDTELSHETQPMT